MGFAEQFVACWNERGCEAAYRLVERLFDDPENQKRIGRPTDFLSDDDDAADPSPAARKRRERRAREHMSPGDGFRELVAGFRPRRAPTELARWVLEIVLESRQSEPAFDAAHPFQPWNELAFELDFYERAAVRVMSRHVRGDKHVKQYRLAHTIIESEDTREDYQFTYDLQNHEDQLVLRYGEEVVGGKVAHELAKAAIYAPYLRETIDALVADEAFAKIPKAFPFRFRFRADEYSKQQFDLELAPALDAAALAEHPLRDVYGEAARVPEVTRDQRFLYYFARAVEDVDAKDELIAIAAGARDLIDALKMAGEDSLLRTRTLAAYGRNTENLAAAVLGDARLEQIFELRAPADPDALVSRVRALGAPLSVVTAVLRGVGETDAARALVRARFELPAPAWAAHPGDEVRTVGHDMEAMRGLVADAPPDERAELDALYDAALERLASSGHPIVALSIMEARVRAERLDDESSAHEPGGAVDELAPPPPDSAAFARLPTGAKVLVRDGSQPYIDAVIASISVREHGRLTDVTVRRLLALGSKARAAEPALRAVLTDLGSTRSNRDAEITAVAEALWRIGAEDVPEEVHKVNHSNPFFMEAFYPKWSKAAPARKLQRLLGALRAEPGAARSPKTWEDGLYDSAPGFAMFRETIAAAPEHDAWIAGLIGAARAANDLVFRFVRYWGREASRNHQALAASLLGAVEERLDDKRAKVAYGYRVDDRSDTARLRRARLHGLAALLDADAPEADAELARLQAVYPGDPTIPHIRSRSTRSSRFIRTSRTSGSSMASSRPPTARAVSPPSMFAIRGRSAGCRRWRSPAAPAIHPTSNRSRSATG